MIIHEKGNIFETTALCIAIPVNCVGVMGKGLALEFKTNYPEGFHAYKEACRKNLIGFDFPTQHCTLEGGSLVALFVPTKMHWKDKSSLEGVEDALCSLYRWLNSSELNNGLPSLALPRLGCGLGGLKWREEVEPLVVGMFGPINNLVTVYE